MNNNYTKIIDWDILTTTWDMIWKDPIGWFLELSLFVQILIIIGLMVLVIAAIVLVYYLLRFLFKGLYQIFKGIYKGLSKLFEGLLYTISGKPRKKDQIVTPISNESIRPPEPVSNFEEIAEVQIPYYCTECGQKMTESMSNLISERGIAFCFYCGKEFTLKKTKKSKT